MSSVFVDVVFRRDKKSSLIKDTKKIASKGGTETGKQFGKNFSSSAKQQVGGLNSVFKITDISLHILCQYQFNDLVHLYYAFG